MRASSQHYAIGEICDLVKGTSPTLKTEPGEYPLVVTAAFRRSSTDWQIEGPAVCVPLVSSTGHGDAAIHRVHYQDGKFALANLLVALKPRQPNVCDAKFLYHLLQARKDELLVPLMLGTANVSLKERDIAGVQVCLPPLDEQRRIVARIEQLAAKITVARALREDAAEELHAIMHAREMEIWPNDALTAAPTLDELTSFLARGRQSEQGESAHYLIKTQHVQMGRYVPTMMRLAPHVATRVQADAILQEGDILIACSAAGCLGRVARFLDPGKCASTDTHVAIARPDPAKVDPDYLYAYLAGAQGQIQLRSRERGDWQREKVGFRLTELNVADMRRVPVPLPSRAEQHRIVAALDALQAKVDAVKALQTETAAELDAMLPAILDKAFKGEL